MCILSFHCFSGNFLFVYFVNGNFFAVAEVYKSLCLHISGRQRSWQRAGFRMHRFQSSVVGSILCAQQLIGRPLSKVSWRQLICPVLLDQLLIIYNYFFFVSSEMCAEKLVIFSILTIKDSNFFLDLEKCSRK